METIICEKYSNSSMATLNHKLVLHEILSMYINTAATYPMKLFTLKVNQDKQKALFISFLMIEL